VDLERQDLALHSVHKFLEGTDTPFSDLKLVWFAKVLKNWKAIVADIGEGGNLYEVTYSGEFNDINVDEYEKINSYREQL